MVDEAGHSKGLGDVTTPNREPYVKHSTDFPREALESDYEDRIRRLLEKLPRL